MTFLVAGPVFAMGAAPDSGSMWVQFVPFAIVLAIFYFIILLPMKRKQQKVQTFLDSLKVNDRVVTTGGIYGLITKLSEQTVQLQVAEKVRIEIAKASIGGYQGQEPVQDAAAERGSQ
jgi:preprotein translocase subunit YajC